MIFHRYMILRQGRVGEVDEFGSVPDDEFGSVPDVVEPSAGPDPIVESQRARRAQLEQQPAGTVDTGVTRRRLILPETTFVAGGPTTTSSDPAVLEETREVRPENVFEQAVHRYAGDAMPGWFGLEAPTGQSMANAAENFSPGWLGRQRANASRADELALRGDIRGAVAQAGQGPLGDALSALVPTAPMAPGTESQTDERARSGVMALGSGNVAAGPWLDEAQGIADALGGGDYTEGRDRARALRDRSEAQAPEASMLGMTPNILGLGLAGGPTAPTAGGRILQMGAVGGVLGGNQGAGEAEELRDVPGGAVTGSWTGGLMAAGGQAVGEGLSLAGRGIARLAGFGENEARTLAASERMRASGLPTNASPRSAYGRTVQRMGGEQGVADALTQENVGGRLPTPNASAGEAERLMQRAGDAMDSVHSQMAASPRQGQVNSDALIDRLSQVRDELAQTRTGPHQAAAQRIQTELIDPLMETIDDVEGARPLTFQQAHALRQSYDELANWSSSGAPADRAIANVARSARTELSGLMNESLETVDPALRAQWSQANRQWQLGALLRDHARSQGSQLPGAIMEGASETLGGGITGRVARGAISNLGPGLRYRGIQALIPVLRAMGGTVGRFAPLLEQAGQRGGQAGLAGLHYVLSRTNPEYRQAIEQAEQQAAQEQTDGAQPL
jgi:hypothetical protein